ncbi:hypothetical protein PGIGA_G00007540 [Pangasianodon gigas]|uniref:Uncharacterized protein n=1 Tax=Pangasianodon gigas TaxID=30993 RepID=A0ACC5W665_PANGG|nr:hypothetical protein [Pangasianodon gigas]
MSSASVETHSPARPFKALQPLATTSPFTSLRDRHRGPAPALRADTTTNRNARNVIDTGADQSMMPSERGASARRGPITGFVLLAGAGISRQR